MAFIRQDKENYIVSSVPELTSQPLSPLKSFIGTWALTILYFIAVIASVNFGTKFFKNRGGWDDVILLFLFPILFIIMLMVFYSILRSTSQKRVSKIAAIIAGSMVLFFILECVGVFNSY